MNSSCDVFQIKEVLITKLRQIEIHDLAELVQISSVMSLAMDDATDLEQKVMVSQSIGQLIYQFNARHKVTQYI